MNYLTQGGVTLERFVLLMQLVEVKSERVINALKAYLVDGFDKKAAMLLYGAKASTFERKIRELNRVAGIVESIKVLDLKHLPEKKEKKRARHARRAT